LQSEFRNRRAVDLSLTSDLLLHKIRGLLVTLFAVAFRLDHRDMAPEAFRETGGWRSHSKFGRNRLGCLQAGIDDDGSWDDGFRVRGGGGTYPGPGLGRGEGGRWPDGRRYAGASCLDFGLQPGFLSLGLCEFWSFRGRLGHRRTVGPPPMVADWFPEHVAQYQFNDDDRNPEKTLPRYRHISL